MLQILLAFFFVCPLLSSAEPKKILLMTVPKAGTHLLMEAVSLITREPIAWQGLDPVRFSPEKDLRGPHKITAAHLFPAFDVIRTRYLDRYIPVLLIRDPRDAVLSFASHLRRGLVWGCCPDFDDTAFFSLPRDLQLKETILFPQSYLSPMLSFPYAVLWMREPSVFVCRFEDLAGAAAGGSEERQVELLLALSCHIGFPKSLEEIREIANELSKARPWTFDKGKIGRWKTEYSEENLSLFLERYGSFISEFGYEM